MVKQKRVLSLFSGCGGMDLGIEGDFWVHQDCVNEYLYPDWIVEKKAQWVRLAKSSFETVFANDIEKRAKNSWIPYFSKRGLANVFHHTSIVDLVKLADEGKFRFPEDIDLITGGFPCQDFSVAGRRLGFNSHKSHTGKILSDDENQKSENRGMLYYWMRRVIEYTLPKVFIAENVKGLISIANAQKAIEEDFSTIGEQGYLVIPKILYASDYGIPQKRERIFFIGLNKSFLNHYSLNEYDLFPPQTHSIVNRINDNLKPYITSKSVLLDLNEPDEEKLDLAQMKYSKAQYLKIGQGQTEIDLDGLSPTIRAEHHGNIEYRRLSLELGGKYLNEINQGMTMRRLTVRECARLQTFPDDYEFVRDRKSSLSDYPLSASGAYKLIGNAVPPLLAYHLSKRLELLWDILFEKSSVYPTSKQCINNKNNGKNLVIDSKFHIQYLTLSKLS